MKNFDRREFIKKTSAAASGVVALNYLNQSHLNDFVASAKKGVRPNILLVNGDDWGWPYCGAYGDKVVRTPSFDRIAREGILFLNTYCSAPSSTPSRASTLTGKMFYLMEGSSVNWGPLPDTLDVYPDILEASGYVVGSALKGWGPGDFRAGGRDHPPAGKIFPDFNSFLNSIPNDNPFCFWLGPITPHRAFPLGSGAESGLSLKDVIVPPTLPDVTEVRNDILDYYRGIELADQLLGAALDLLDKSGMADNTIVVVIGDNGMPFPRAKASLYDLGIHVPMAIRWPAKIKPGRMAEDFISLCDLAPTFLEAAGLKPPADMTGKSILDILLSSKSGQIDPHRDFIVTGSEFHEAHYPSRSIRTRNYSYIQNFKPGRFEEVNRGPTLTYMVKNAKDPKVKPFYDLCYESRPAEELYELLKDPFEVKNLADDPAYAHVKEKMASDLKKYLIATHDPRAIGEEEKFDKYVQFVESRPPFKR